jgi:hypothetical protein
VTRNAIGGSGRIGRNSHGSELMRETADLRKLVNPILRSLRLADRGVRISAYFARCDALALAKAAEVLAKRIGVAHDL